MTESVAISGNEDAVVFVVDDDQSVRDALKDLLESVRLQVQSFGSTQEFLHSKRSELSGLSCARYSDARDERPRLPT